MRCSCGLGRAREPALPAGWLAAFDPRFAELLLLPLPELRATSALFFSGLDNFGASCAVFCGRLSAFPGSARAVLRLDSAAAAGRLRLAELLWLCCSLCLAAFGLAACRAAAGFGAATEGAFAAAALALGLDFSAFGAALASLAATSSAGRATLGNRRRAAAECCGQ